MAEARTVTAVDLFSGCGGLTCGLEEAARRAGRHLDIRLALDVEPRIGAVYRRNFPSARTVVGNVSSTFGGRPGDVFDDAEERLSTIAGGIDFLLAGPPCQGHSDLNNHTRRSDPKNALYLKVARAAAVLRPRVMLVENVPAVRHDHDDVVAATCTALEKLDYRIDARVVDLGLVGVPQRRRRFLLVASATDSVDPTRVVEDVLASWGTHEPRSVAWAIDDLEDREPTTPSDRPTTMNPDSVRRIDYLFEHGLYELPDSERPWCHREKPHSYKSVYGRLHWEQPAQTITSGFGTMGQGRYVHPSRRRTLTAHEAARLQGFPDWFDWGSASRTVRATMIGNAVPPFLSLAMGSRILPLIDE